MTSIGGTPKKTRGTSHVDYVEKKMKEDAQKFISNHNQPILESLFIQPGGKRLLSPEELAKEERRRNKIAEELVKEEEIEKRGRTRKKRSKKQKQQLPLGTNNNQQPKEAPGIEAAYFPPTNISNNTINSSICSPSPTNLNLKKVHVAGSSLSGYELEDDNAKFILKKKSRRRRKKLNHLANSHKQSNGNPQTTQHKHSKDDIQDAKGKNQGNIKPRNITDVSTATMPKKQYIEAIKTSINVISNSQQSNTSPLPLSPSSPTTPLQKQQPISATSLPSSQPPITSKRVRELINNLKVFAQQLEQYEKWQKQQSYHKYQ